MVNDIASAVPAMYMAVNSLCCRMSVIAWVSIIVGGVVKRVIKGD